MKTKLELKNKLTGIIQLILDARKLMNDSYKMLMTDSSEKFTLISRTPFLTRVRDSFWKLSVIELTKLYGAKNDNYRLDALLDQLIVNYKASEWTTDISETDLLKLQAHLNDNEVQFRKAKLKELRDQHYAHKDLNPRIDINSIGFYYTDFAYLLRSAELIVEELMQKILGLPTSFKTYEGEDVDDFLNTLLKSRKSK